MRKKTILLPALIMAAGITVADAQKYSVPKLRIYDANDALVGHVIGFLDQEARIPLIAVKPTPDDVVLIRVDVSSYIHKLIPNRDVSLFYFESDNCSGTPYVSLDSGDRLDRHAGFLEPGQTLYLPDREAIPGVQNIESYCVSGGGDCRSAVSGPPDLVPAINTGMDFSVYEPPFRMS